MLKAIEGSKHTFETFVREILDEAMLRKDEIDKIFPRIQEVMKDSMDNRWHDTINGYPTSLLPSIALTAKHVALEWLNETHPNHFARFMLGAPLPEQLPE